MPTEQAKTETTTNLRMPKRLKDRVMKQAAKDRRNFKPELLELLEEALQNRERRSA